MDIISARVPEAAGVVIILMMEKVIVDKAVEKPFMGIFGTEKVNVLKLNAALEKAK